ncbi:MAG: phosphatidylserine decarboxylase family protein [Thermodesulfobacteriota bacterium]
MSREGRRFPVVREGMVFILPLASITLILWSLRFTVPAGFFSLITLFVIYFFRDPERLIPPEEKAILSPADGKVIRVEPCREERFLKGSVIKISVFMSLFSVHVNRIPLTGTIAHSSYFPGKFFSADLDKASSANEQNALLIETAEGVRILTVQIAGLIARRIVCWVGKGDRVVRGQRFGLIRFGSRLDIYLPQETRVQAQPGQKAYGGQTILGYLP